MAIKKPKIIVVGGGLGGLFTASELAAKGRDVLVLDASPEPGGVARTIARHLQARNDD